MFHFFIYDITDITEMNIMDLVLGSIIKTDT